MKKMTIRCSGVPEHFNLPWKIAMEKGLFAKEGIDFHWIDNGSGTGAMCQDLREGKTDLAVMLTEGAVRDLHRGNPSQLCSFYVDTPLVWGVHAAATSELDAEQLPSDLSFAISRFTSGSHLMAYVYGENKGLQLQKHQFEVIHDLKGARESLAGNTNQLFLWEKFTTKWLVDKEEFKLVDECPTPWPAFVVVASNELLAKGADKVQKVLDIVQRQAKELAADPEIIPLIARRYGLSRVDAAIWFSGVRWSQHSAMDLTTLDKVAQTLSKLDLLEGQPNWERMIWKGHSIPEPMPT